MLKEAFGFARSYVTARGFSEEIEWQDSVHLGLLTEETFLREYAWVVLSTGMREAIVRGKFPKISECFYRFKSTQDIAEHAEGCVQAAIRVFRHEPKMRAIALTATLVAREGFPSFKKKLEGQPLATVRSLPYIGPVTQFHLAKNIGLDVAKPDRHLSRIAALYGYPTVENFCRAVAHDTGCKVAVIDLVFWRFATLQRNYLDVLHQFALVGR